MTWHHPRRGRVVQFQPRLTLEHTGWSGPSRWQWVCAFVNSRGAAASFGLDCSDQMTVGQAWAAFYAVLRKWGNAPGEKGGAR